MVIRRISAAAWLLIALGAVFTIAGTQSAGAVGSPVGLGSAGSFAVLAGSTVTNTGESEISGDLGVSPGSAITGFPPGIVTNGVIHAGSAVAIQAQSDLTTAYNEAASRSTTATVTADLAGQTLLSGVYTGGALALNGTLTLDGENDPGAVFVFQASSTLITGPSSSINLINGADPCNVFWQVGSSATLGTGTDFVGTVMANVSITANTGATVDGRLLARTGAVTLDDNVINASNCGSSSGGTTTTTEADGGGDTTTTEGNAGGGDTTTTEGNAGGGDTTTTEGNAGGGDTTTTEGNAGGGDTTTTEGNAGGGDTTTTEAAVGAGSTTSTEAAAGGGDTTTTEAAAAGGGGETTTTAAATMSELPETGGFNLFAAGIGLLSIGIGMLVLLAARRDPSTTHLG